MKIAREAILGGSAECPPQPGRAKAMKPTASSVTGCAGIALAIWGTHQERLAK
jgi:hypothetical protein